MDLADRLTWSKARKGLDQIWQSLEKTMFT